MTVQPYCGQAAPVFEDRNFRTGIRYTLVICIAHLAIMVVKCTLIYLHTIGIKTYHLSGPIYADNVQCGVHYTDQQYTIDPVSGNVVVEWEGTGPNELVQVSKFKCKLDGVPHQPCKSLLILVRWNPVNQ